MNLHIVPDSKFINTFSANLRELGLLSENRLIVASKRDVKYVEGNFPRAPLYSSTFKSICGDTMQYQAVYIHLFSPLMYRWVVRNSFRQLNWMVWGADLYNLPGIKADFYDAITRREYSSQGKHLDEWLYLLKVWITNSHFKDKAYAKIDHVLTWMTTEYAFAKSNIPTLRASHKFFFYENQIPYQKLDERSAEPKVKNRNVPLIIVGNSGYATNNHLDAIAYMEKHDVKADLCIPVSYGDKRYINFLKRRLATYTNGTVIFVDKYMDFDEYLNLLSSADAFVMNSIRPQGYGNVLMMLYLGKPVFMNEMNISAPDLKKNGIVTTDWSEMNSILQYTPPAQNKHAIANMLSHSRLIDVYRDLFS
jgi:dTDP-N-acetylfucosamine:lipid II N-acetylfucosaminyltransferase